jgi:O6-methylguanine-DNA--protein-cysteine methyltransferase
VFWDCEPLQEDRLRRGGTGISKSGNWKTKIWYFTTLFFYNFEKKVKMTAAELKLKIFRQVDSLEESRLEELYGVFLNYINGQKDLEDWTKLTTEQQQGIIDAIEEIESGKGISHETVLTNIRRKFSHA